MEQPLSTEELIKEAAKKVFVRSGYAGARMQEIADEAGINKALLHYYYRSKEKLFEVVFMEVFARLLPQINSILTSDQGILDKLDAVVEKYVLTIREHPHLPLFVVHELSQNPERMIARIQGQMQPPDLAILFQNVQTAVEKGEIRPVHPVHLVLNVLAMCVFPFIARPMLKAVAMIDDQQFEFLMQDRIKETQAFIRAALRPD